MQVRIGASWSKLVLDLDDKWMIKKRAEPPSTARPDATFDFKRNEDVGVQGNIMIGYLGKDDSHDPQLTQRLAEEFVRFQGATMLRNSITVIDRYSGNDLEYRMRDGRTLRKVSVVMDDLEYVLTFDFGHTQDEISLMEQQSDTMLKGITWKAGVQL